MRAAVDQEPKTEKEQKEKAEGSGASGRQDPEEVTKKYGLEAGLWQVIFLFWNFTFAPTPAS